MDWIKDRTKKQITLMRPFSPGRISMSCALVKSNIILHNLMLGCTSRKYLISIDFTFWHNTLKIRCSLHGHFDFLVHDPFSVYKDTLISLYRSVQMEYARWREAEVMYMNKFLRNPVPILTKWFYIFRSYRVHRIHKFHRFCACSAEMEM